LGDEFGFYAYALDKKVLTVASNAGHCLWSGIVPRDRAKIVVERLMAPDMWTGWGICTLSADNPATIPTIINRAVWPHDNGIIAAGFERYGFNTVAGRIAHDLRKTASCFLLNPLPELYTAFPVQYIGTNAPQAWAAGSIFLLTQAMLGFLPDVPLSKLYVGPALPGVVARLNNSRSSSLAGRRTNRV
jgi:glycogen debranching enzyme